MLSCTKHNHIPRKTHFFPWTKTTHQRVSSNTFMTSDIVSLLRTWVLPSVAHFRRGAQLLLLHPRKSLRWSISFSIFKAIFQYGWVSPLKAIFKILGDFEVTDLKSYTWGMTQRSLPALENLLEKVEPFQNPYYHLFFSQTNWKKQRDLWESVFFHCTSMFNMNISYIHLARSQKTALLWSCNWRQLAFFERSSSFPVKIWLFLGSSNS